MKRAVKRISFFLLVLMFIITETILASDYITEQKLADIEFSYPETKKITTTETQYNDNIFVVNDNKFTTVTGSYSDLYYTVMDHFSDYDRDIVEKSFPKDGLWLFCGAFDESWADEDFVFDYLCSIVNNGSVIYDCSMELIDLRGLPFYKFFFMVNNINDPPGGIIYLTVYRSKQYMIEFVDHMRFSNVLEYSNVFEETLFIDGVNEFTFEKYQINEIPGVEIDSKTGLKNYVIYLGILWIILILMVIVLNHLRGADNEQK